MKHECTLSLFAYHFPCQRGQLGSGPDPLAQFLQHCCHQVGSFSEGSQVL